jgi:hypothetical protein
MAYVSDLNYDDQNMHNPPVLNPGEAFRKGWRIKTPAPAPGTAVMC